MNNHDNNTWAKYYSERNKNFLNIALHYQYLFAILFCNPRSILEIGCGTAEHSVFIKKIFKKINIDLLDNDPDILLNAKKLNIDFIEETFLVDILDKKSTQNLKSYDVVMSQGLMEHFNEQDFIKIIENFRPVAKNFIFSIPSNFYPTLDYGNEILRSKYEITEILNKISKIDYSVNGYFDIGINTKFVGLRKSSGLYNKLKYFFLSSNHVLVKISYHS